MGLNESFLESLTPQSTSKIFWEYVDITIIPHPLYPIPTLSAIRNQKPSKKKTEIPPDDDWPKAEFLAELEEMEGDPIPELEVEVPGSERSPDRATTDENRTGQNTHGLWSRRESRKRKEGSGGEKGDKQVE